MFFKIKSEPTTEVINYCFFIPVVEQFKQSDYATSRAWNLARSHDTIRKFYNSPESLRQAEASYLPEEAELSCYKVTLTEEQFSLLNSISSQPKVFKGFVAIAAQQIESMLVFHQSGVKVELNPFYEVDAPHASVGMA